MRIADSHTHIFPSAIAEKASHSIAHFYDEDITLVAAMDTLQQQETIAGVDYYLVSSSATSAEQVDHINTFISSCAKQDPKMIPFGTLFPTMENWQAPLEQMPELGLRGIKIHSDFQKIDIDEPKSIEMYRAIAKMGLPVLFHMGDFRYDYSAPERLTNLIRQVPDLIAIAAHFGGWQTWDRSYAQHFPENVYYDTSSSLMYMGKEKALELLEKMDTDRFMFGSDFPMWSPSEELERFLDLGLDESTNKKILFENFERLFLK